MRGVALILLTKPEAVALRARTAEPPQGVHRASWKSALAGTVEVPATLGTFDVQIGRAHV